MSTPQDPRHRYAATRQIGSARDLSRPLPAAVSWTTLIAFIAAFGVAFVVLGLPRWMPLLYAVMSIIAFATYGLDKRAARRGAQRVSEQNLLTIGFLCGWPGALVAQQVFRHKTRKRSFRRPFWTSVALNVLVLAAFITLATIQGWDLTPSWLPDLGWFTG